MAYNNIITKEEKYIFASGIPYFAPFDSTGSAYLGERDLGNCPVVNIDVASEVYKHNTSRTANRQQDFTQVLSVSFNAKLDCEDISSENVAFLFAGSKNTITQASGNVTGERIKNMEALREYQLGETSSNPGGVRGVSSVTVKLWEASNAATRVNSTLYTVGSVFKSGSNAFVVTAEGTTAGAAPAFATAAIGDATTDGTATVKWVGNTTAYTVTTDYLLSPASGRIATPAGGKPALAAAVMPAGFYLSFSVDYTTDANTREQIVTTSAGTIKGKFRFISDNGDGKNRDVLIPSCSLSVSGQFPLVTGKEIAKLTFDLGVNERDTNTPQIIIDGRPIY